MLSETQDTLLNFGFPTFDTCPVEKYSLFQTKLSYLSLGREVNLPRHGRAVQNCFWHRRLELVMKHVVAPTVEIPEEWDVAAINLLCGLSRTTF